MNRLLLVTDAWMPQTNGVVTTLREVIEALPAIGWETEIIHPGLFRTLGLPTYGEIRVAIDPWRLKDMVDPAAYHAVHIATEGPLGLFARRLCVKEGIPFTTSLHTKFPEYVQARTGLPLAIGYRLMRWFHAPASSTLCTTPSHRRELEQAGFQHLVVWDRGVDIRRFKPDPARAIPVRPRLLYVGRVAPEKNLEAFLDLDLNAERVVVGDGPSRAALQARYPDVSWRGYRHGEALVAEYAAADVFVFPSRTDTFGLVMLEAMACGTPVSAFPVTGPNDVVINGVNGWLDEDLGTAVTQALTVSRTACRRFAEQRGWGRIAERLVTCASGDAGRFATGVTGDGTATPATR